MLEPQTVTFLQGGCAQIVGTTLPDGAPFSLRGWGIEVRSASDGVVALVLGTSDTDHLPHLATGGPIAITGADVPTLRSLQIKGRGVGLVPAGPHDIEIMERYCDGFFGDVFANDGTPRELMQRMVPASLTVCTVEVDTIFDQTPGPAAGAPLTRDSPTTGRVTKDSA